MTKQNFFDVGLKVKDKQINALPDHDEVQDPSKPVGSGRFPSWLHRKLPKGLATNDTSLLLKTNRLHTVCEEARCPNLLECYSKKTATFLVLGKSCTRACGFCQIDFSKTPQQPDPDEPNRVATSVQSLGLSHVVITMVARDDLDDGGAAHLVQIIRTVRALIKDITIEVLTSDFAGNFVALSHVLDEEPEIFNHNLETVLELTSHVRHKATYERTLEILHFAKFKYPKQIVKSGIMLGLGETQDQVAKTLHDLAKAHVDIVTMGQYLQPGHKKLLVKEFIHPDLFREYERIGREYGIKHVYAGPFIRSSYNANLFVEKAGKKHSISSQ